MYSPYDNNDPGAGPVNPNPYDPANPPPGMRWDPTQNTFVPIAPSQEPGTFTPNPTPPGVAPYVPGAPGSYQPGSPNDPNRAPTYQGTLTSTGDNSLGGLIAPFTASPPPLPGTGTPYIPQTPVFTPPTYTPYAPFVPPTGQSVQDEPGYKFGLDQGEQSLQGSAAARGTLNTGGTLKDILSYGQQYAGQQYGQAFNRELQTYGQNLQSQNIIPYEMAFQGAQAAFAPQMTAYSTQAAAGQRANEFNTNTAMQQYQDAYNQWLAQENLKFGYRAPLLNG
jgi:hypothetical protein